MMNQSKGSSLRKERITQTLCRMLSGSTYDRGRATSSERNAADGCHAVPDAGENPNIAAQGGKCVRYEVLIFDLDGTLVDSFPAIQMSLSKAMQEVGSPPWDLEETKRHVGHGVEFLVESAVGRERKEDALRVFRQDYGETCHKATPLLPFVRPTLAVLRERGYRLAVATNKPILFTNRILTHLRIESCFACILGPDLVPNRKPHPDMINEVRNRLHADPRTCLYVGDMPLDVETATRAGVDCLLVATGAFSLARLRQEVSVPVLDDFAALPDFLDGAEQGGESNGSPNTG